ncbi:MAG: PKD domain-containing protein [Pseudobdellovibrio sp.]
MHSNQIIITTLLAMVLTTACQKTTSVSDLDSLNSGLSETCSDNTNSEDLTLKINGSASAQAGEQVSYQLNKKVCGSSQKVLWTSEGSKPTQATNAKLVSSFASAGVYVISAKVENTSDSSLSSQAIQKTIIVAKAPALLGPQVVLLNTSSNYSLVLPTGFVLNAASWSFGDSTPAVISSSSVSHTYAKAGLFVLTVNARDSLNKLYVISQTVNVFTDSAQVACASQATISSPTEGTVNSPLTISGYIPDCLKVDLTSFVFDYGDGTTGTALSADHTFTNAGSFQVNLNIGTIFQDDPNIPYLRLTQTIQVLDTVANCPGDGVTRETLSDSFTQVIACGLDGKKNQIYKTNIVEQCKLTSGTLSWIEISRNNVLQSEGPCQGQSCHLPDNSILSDGKSVTLYSSSNPAGLCTEQSLVRTCLNGVLSGSENYSSLTCHNGCGDFGANGTIKVGVITGEIQTAITCSFNETGFFNTFNQISDKSCIEGQIVLSNTHQGDLKHADTCPSYHWQATEIWSTCSADCGGNQTEIFNCQNNNNEPADEKKCTTLKPTQSRACDGNPAAVAHIDRTIAEEESGSSVMCPKNQIGVIVKNRTATTVKSYACVDHSVQKTEEHIEYSAWETHEYCRDYVAHRCSQDSLNNSQAQGRYKWMVKCENKIPVIKEFLDNFDTVKGSRTFGINSTSRVLYPTFLVRTISGKETVWIAPTTDKSDCVAPATAYVAAVCVSSCATPEQQILVEAKEQINKMKYTSYIDALTQKFSGVGTLSASSTMNSTKVKTTKVEQWVTELLDTEHKILEFHMKSGRSIRLTPNHPVVAANGSMQLAETFKAGDSLVQLGGQLDPITSIVETKYIGKVYNLFVKSAKPLENIVVTNGYLNGTAFFQNEGAVNMNRNLLRQKLTKGVFSK